MLVQVESKKCEQYWPDAANGSIQVGEFEITLLEEQWKSPTVVHRRLLMKSAMNCAFELLHIQYTGWPDHALPLEESEFESVLQSSFPFRSNLLVHCSAGVGRTGTFITALSMLAKQFPFASSNELLQELKSTICLFRRQRVMIVQNERQFLFLARFLCNKICL